MRGDVVALKSGFRGGLATVVRVLQFLLCWRLCSPSATMAISATLSVSAAMAAAKSASETPAFTRERNMYCSQNYKGMSRLVEDRGNSEFYYHFCLRRNRNLPPDSGLATLECARSRFTGTNVRKKDFDSWSGHKLTN